MLTQLTPRQLEVALTPKKRLNIYDGSIRSGKTVESLLEWLRFVRTAPPGNLAMVGKTERTLTHNVIHVLQEWLGERRCRHSIGEGELWLLGRRIYLYGANDEKAQNKIKGLTLLGAYGDELATWPESFFVMLLGRLSERGARFFGTTNPDGPKHWLKANYIDRAEELSLARFHFKLADNTFLDEDFVENAKRENVGLWRLRYIEGLWAAAEGAIYDLWDERLHVVDELPQMRFYWLAIDYGFTAPFVALLFGLGCDNRIYVCGEWRYEALKARRQLSSVEYADRLQRWLFEMGKVRLEGSISEHSVEPRWVFVDPSATFKVDLMRQGFRAVGDATNDVLDGIRQVASALAQDRLKVHRSCHGLLDEFPGYVWEQKKQELGIDEPRKENDHSLDALRYGVASTHSVWYRLPLLQPERAA